MIRSFFGPRSSITFFLKNDSKSEIVVNCLSVIIIPEFTRNSIALTNSVSEIASVDHHPAVFFTQSGTPCELLVDWDEVTSIIPSFTRNWIALTNSFSEIASVDHHPAVFFTQSGVVSALICGIRIMKITRIGKIDAHVVHC